MQIMGWSLQNYRKSLLTVFLFLIIALASMWLIPVGWDFQTNFLAAGKAVLAGSSPYDLDGFFNPPWLLVFLGPLALFPDRLAWGIFFSFSILSYVWALRRMGARNLDIILFMASPFIFYSSLYGNIEFLILLGATFPPVLGVWFLTLKPQVTIALLFLWGIQSIQVGWRELLKNFAPVSIVAGASLVLGLIRNPDLRQVPWNISAWPYGIASGILLTCLALKRSDEKLALAASPYFSPYVAVQSWMVALTPALRSTWLVLGVLLGWSLVLMRMTIPSLSIILEPFLLFVWGILIFVRRIID
jgi:hypothetical protein